jgi:hypothetical protein
MIPSRRFASVAGDQGIPLFEEAMREWEAQPVTSPPPIFAVAREILVKTCSCGHSRDVHYYPELPGQPACSVCPSCRTFEITPDVRRES